jgi:hypothetical protein
MGEVFSGLFCFGNKTIMIAIENPVIGQEVVDSSGDRGEIVSIDDLHNVYVKFFPTESILKGNGLYCLVEDCDHFEPLFFMSTI